MSRPKKIYSNSLLYTIIASTFLIGSFAVSLIKPSKIYMKEPAVKGTFDVALIPVPLVTEPFPILSAQGVIATDIKSGVVLYEKNADAKLLPASTTKIMTALVVLGNYNLDSVITVPKFAVVGQKMGLTWGEQITVKNLLYGLLVYSANDAAETFARSFPQGRQAFIDLMNQKAKELHLENTHFNNPVGLDDPNNYSSARDLVRLSAIAMQNKTFADTVKTEHISVKSVDDRFVHDLKNINELLGKVPGVIGVKTGWTENARENLVTYVTRDGHDIIIALLGSQDRFGETESLIEWLYKNYQWKKVSPDTYSP